MNTLPIIAQDTSWIVINKPAGISVHNAGADSGQDVIQILKKQLKPGTFTDIHPVHRLDKETSGLLLIALNSKAAKELAEQFQERNCEKTYIAVLRGALPLSENWQSWGMAISDKSEGRKNPQGLSKDRVEARTDFKVVKVSHYFSLIEVKLLTGRQHQIRKHSAIAKHNIIGDGRYGDPKYNERMAKIYGTDRMFLHAARLKINIGGKERVFEAPRPEEFEALFREATPSPV
ncbi:RluA family pseudouridine synthase [Bdellovibrio svalbardensis]|uniref:RNA pseudouridine synthase n=1 Tax=Bdellovibrio svalbardensis TaxID=2972972 RepID=A0ABT6DLI8_9BACT|nr:RNA pseudouridine synthase [Bdellovibrio svalbardensis]MDG0817740.1 RNA pseudouridine synthase [Bdellovibrio svalbardensis]